MALVQNANNAKSGNQSEVMQSFALDYFYAFNQLTKLLTTDLMNYGCGMWTTTGSQRDEIMK